MAYLAIVLFISALYISSVLARRKRNGKKRILIFILSVLVVTMIANIVIFHFEEYSILYNETQKITWQYVIYAFIGVFFETPAPFWAYLFTKKICDKTSIKDSIKDVFRKKSMTITLLTIVVVALLIYAFGMINGTWNGAPKYLMFLSVPLLVIGGGIEEVGWRGLLQPELEKKVSYPIATLIVSLIWWSWHLTLWLQPSSNHYGDSMIGFLIMIITWSFLLSVVYKVTRCTFACVLVHAIVNSLGAVYDWNDLFDCFPTRLINIICYSVVIIFSIIIWYLVDRKAEKPGFK